jgi:surface antigen
VPGSRLRPPRYRGTPQARLRRRPIAASLVVLALATTAGGCSYQLDSLKGKGSAEVDPTGSLRPTTARQVATLPPENDLEVARAAVAELLTRGGKDSSVPWENPRTGARGTITPIASAYSQDGLTCQDFLASYVRGGTEAWLQGEACRLNQGKWEVRNLKPWQRT